MADGHSNPAIGRALHISLSAVEKHATSIFVKFGVTRVPDTHRRVAALPPAAPPAVVLPDRRPAPAVALALNLLRSPRSLAAAIVPLCLPSFTETGKLYDFRVKKLLSFRAPE